MERTDLPLQTRNERLAYIVERCLESPAAYKLFDMLASISDLDKDAKLEYMELVKDSGAYSDEEISAIERLIVSGAARYFKGVIDQVREEQVACEIEAMLVYGPRELLRRRRRYPACRRLGPAACFGSARPIRKHRRAP